MKACQSLFAPLFMGSLLALSLASEQANAVEVARQDFDGGLNLLSETYSPDNTSRNGLFSDGASRFDRFGIANVATADANDVDLGLPFDVVDESESGFPEDTKGMVSKSKTDNFFVSVDVNNTNNPDANGNGKAVWTFDVSDHQNLSLSIDMAMLGDFEVDDIFTFSYSIDGSATQTAFDVKIRGIDDGMGGLTDAGDTYAITMDNGSVYQGASNSFFSGAEWAAIGCTEIDLDADPVVAPVAGSCSSEVAGDDEDGFEYWRPHFDDTNKDGYVYFDTTTETLVDTPTDASDLTVGAIRIYEDENSNGTFRTPEITGPNKDPLTIGGDATMPLTNQLGASSSTFSTNLTGTGSVLTLTLDAVNDGSNEYFAFDNIVIEGTPTSGGLACDLDADGQCDIDDIEMVIDNVVAGGDATAIATWLTNASGTNNPYLGGTKTFAMGDINLDGSVDSADLGQLLNSFGSTSAIDWANGNVNGDGVVDSADLGELLNSFGSSSAAAAQAVPEPSCLSLLAVAMLGLVGLGRRRK